MATRHAEGGRPAAEPRSFEFGRLSRGERACGVASVVMLLAASMTWLTADEDGTVPVGGSFETSSHTSPSGWETLSGAWELVVVLGIIGGIGVAVLAARAGRPEPPVLRGTAMVALGALSVLAAINSYDDYSQLDETLFSTKEPKAGLGLFVMAAIGLAVGGWVLRREDREAGAERRDHEDG